MDLGTLPYFLLTRRSQSPPRVREKDNRVWGSVGRGGEWQVSGTRLQVAEVADGWERIDLAIGTGRFVPEPVTIAT